MRLIWLIKKILKMAQRIVRLAMQSKSAKMTMMMDMLNVLRNQLNFAQMKTIKKITEGATLCA